MSNRKYWFLEDSESLIDSLSAHHATWLQYGSNLMAQNWLRNTIAYNSTILEPNDWQSALGYTGDQGELVRMVVPQARSFIRQTVTLATKQRLFFSCIAESNDSDVLQDTRLGNALAEDIVWSQNLDRKRESRVESACVLGMSFYKVLWRTDKGTPYLGELEDSTDENGTAFKTPIVHYDGDLEISCPTIQDVYWDSRIHDWDDLDWAECRTVKNRWNMIASFPHLEDDILKICRIDEEQIVQGQQSLAVENEDLIYVYEAYHKPSPALPKGRMIVYSSRDTVYYDDVNPYECIPIVCLKPEPIDGMTYGYPKLNDLLPSQEMFDMCLSAAATNNSATAVQSILCPREANINVNEINGVNWIYYTPSGEPGGGIPQSLQLTKTAPETFKLADMLKQEMMELSNLNSAVRGAPPPGVTSGTAIATLTANALEFMSSLSKSDQLALERVMFLGIWFYSKFATIERIVSVTGKGNQSFAKTFVGADLASIKKVRFIGSNPLMNTIGGRADVAEKMLQNGLIKDAQQYFQILEGAPPEIIYKGDLSQEDLISRENEALLDGRPVLLLKTDDHPKHILHHASLLNDPMVRANSGQTEQILAHMQAHEDAAKTMDPFLAAMIATGKMPQGGPPPPMGPPPGGPMPPQPPGPPPGPQAPPPPGSQAGGHIPSPGAPPPAPGTSPMPPGHKSVGSALAPAQATDRPAMPTPDLLHRGAQ